MIADAGSKRDASGRAGRAHRANCPVINVVTAGSRRGGLGRGSSDEIVGAMAKNATFLCDYSLVATAPVARTARQRWTRPIAVNAAEQSPGLNRSRYRQFCRPYAILRHFGWILGTRSAAARLAGGVVRCARPSGHAACGRLADPHVPSPPASSAPVAHRRRRQAGGRRGEPHRPARGLRRAARRAAARADGAERALLADLRGRGAETAAPRRCRSSDCSTISPTSA